MPKNLKPILRDEMIILRLLTMCHYDTERRKIVKKFRCSGGEWASDLPFSWRFLRLLSYQASERRSSYFNFNGRERLQWPQYIRRAKYESRPLQAAFLTSIYKRFAAYFLNTEALDCSRYNVSISLTRETVVLRTEVWKYFCWLSYAFEELCVVDELVFFGRLLCNNSEKTIT